VNALPVLLLAAAAVVLPAETVRVSPSGQRSLQAAIDSARNGDSIVLAAGTYSSAAAVTLADRERLTLRGEGDVRIVCMDLYQNVIAVIGGRDLRIEGIQARHAQPLNAYECEGSVIWAENVKGLVISRCELAGSGSIGVDLSGSEEVEVTGCWLHNNTFAAISLTDVSSITISDNRIVGNAATMYAAGVSGLTMAGNVISDNGASR